MKNHQSVKTVCAVSFAAIALLFWSAQREPDIASLSDAEVSTRLVRLRKELTPPSHTTSIDDVAAVYGQPRPRTEQFRKGWFYDYEIPVETNWLKNRRVKLLFNEKNGKVSGARFVELQVVNTRSSRSSSLQNGLKQAPMARIVTPQMLAALKLAQKQADKLRHEYQVAENRKDLKTLMLVERKFGALAREQGWGDVP